MKYLPAVTSGIPLLNTIYNVDALEMLKAMPDNFINCVVTSPPYWGLRDYGVAGQMGMESTLDEYLANMVRLFREMRRVLREDGVLWLNMGDCYATAANGRSAADTKATGEDDRTFRDKPFSTIGNGLKNKDLVGQAWELALALRRDGWYLRADCIWHKPNPMPASVKDRPTTAHEYVFLLTKSEQYWIDLECMKTPVKESSKKRQGRAVSDSHKNHNGAPGQTPHSMNRARPNTNKQDALGKRTYTGFNERYEGQENPMAHPRSVWTIPTVGFEDAHFATFPIELVKPLVESGCPATVCACCGAPYQRKTEAVGGSIGKSWHNHENDAEHGQRATDSRAKGGHGYHVIDLGFFPTCTCNAPTRAGITYDPFMGSGTIALVARSLKRDYLGTELNTEYIKMQKDRLRKPFEKKQVVKKSDLAGLPLFEGIQN